MNGQPAAEPVEIVVRRGALRRFDALKRKTAELPVVVTWDRRLADRRGTTNKVEGERRQTDRRKQPPFTWDLADFVVIGETPDPDAAARPQTKAKNRSKIKA